MALITFAAAFFLIRSISLDKSIFVENGAQGFWTRSLGKKDCIEEQGLVI